MENEGEEENKPKKHKSTAFTPDWLDLPNPIATNIVLEHLEIDDYIRFSAVCKKWQSIQREHRIRYSPFLSPSPLPFPWLTCSYHRRKDENRSICFYLPEKQKSYDIPVHYSSTSVCTRHYTHGWLLLLHTVNENDWWFSIFNPITGEKIKLPPLLEPVKVPSALYFVSAYISSSPVDTECTILVLIESHKLYLCRLNGNSGWKKINCYERQVYKLAFFNNKFYYAAYGYRRIYIVDTLLSEPVAQTIEMDLSEISEDLYWSRFHALDLLGELVIVIIEKDTSARFCYSTMKEIHVFKADFSTNKWVRMESLSDHVLFVSLDSTFSFPAIDVTGCKKNTIYSTTYLKGCGVAWRAFNLGTRDWIDGPPMLLPLPKYEYSMGGRHWSWFFPTLDRYNVVKMNGAPRIKLE